VYLIETGLKLFSEQHVSTHEEGIIEQYEGKLVK